MCPIFNFSLPLLTRPLIVQQTPRNYGKTLTTILSFIMSEKRPERPDQWQKEAPKSSDPNIQRHSCVYGPIMVRLKVGVTKSIRTCERFILIGSSGPNWDTNTNQITWCVKKTWEKQKSDVQEPPGSRRWSRPPLPSRTKPNPPQRFQPNPPATLCSWEFRRRSCFERSIKTGTGVSYWWLQVKRNKPTNDWSMFYVFSLSVKKRQ